MKLIDVKTLLALQVMARTAAGDFFALDSMRHYLLDRDPHAYMPFNLFAAMEDPDFVPLAVFSQYEAAIGDCDKDAQEELRRIMSEFMSTEEYSRQVEAYNRLHQMGYDNAQK